MSWDQNAKPVLRSVEPVQAPGAAQGTVALRDPSRLSDGVMQLSEPALFLLSLLDGDHTLKKMLERFRNRYGCALPWEKLTAILDQLDRHHFLAGPSFEAYFASLTAAYRRADARVATPPLRMGIDTDLGSFFEEYFAELSLPASNHGRQVGLIAPHLDFPRGRPCYRAAYQALAGRVVPDRIVILGTNHFGRSTSVVATAKDFQTPLGRTANDTAFLEQLEQRCGTLREFEHDHRHEHSVELQVMWLQHRFGAESFQIVPLLCPDPCGPAGTAPINGRGIPLDVFARALAELVAADQADTLVVAGADLSHIGGYFGDAHRLEDGFLDKIRDRDAETLAAIGAGDAERLRACVARDGNPTRVCSAGCIYSLLAALPDASATTLAYHQAVNHEVQNCVTCAAVVLHC